MVQSLAQPALPVTPKTSPPRRPMPQPSPTIHRRLDITRDVCPITFVKTKLELEEMKPRECLEVLVREGESLTNVARSVAMDGHEVLVREKLATPPPGGGQASVWRLLIERGEAAYAQGRP